MIRKRKINKIMLIAFALIISNSTFSQDWGVGIRLGDPSGLTFKKYTKGSAIEISFGQTHVFNNSNNFYNNYFNDWYFENNFIYTDFNFIGYKTSSPLGMQLHYIIQKGLSKVAGENTNGLEWYFGGGLQVRTQSYTYDYQYKIAENKDWFYATSNKLRNIDIGIDGVIGLEYTFKEVPVSLFLDATLFMEIADTPFKFWGQGGLGARYRF